MVDFHTPLPDVDKAGVLRHLPHRDPFLFVDSLTEIRAYTHAVGRYHMHADHAFYAGHFPGYPITPGVITCEALAQTAALLLAYSSELVHEEFEVFLLGIDKARFKRPILPGEHLTLTIDLVGHKRDIWLSKCTAHVEGALAVSCELKAMLRRKQTDAVPAGSESAG